MLCVSQILLVVTPISHAIFFPLRSKLMSARPCPSGVGSSTEWIKANKFHITGFKVVKGILIINQPTKK